MMGRRMSFDGRRGARLRPHGEAVISAVHVGMTGAFVLVRLEPRQKWDALKRAPTSEAKRGLAGWGWREEVGFRVLRENQRVAGVLVKIEVLS
jgi:hypothetical protein